MNTDWPVPVKHSRFWRVASILTSTFVGVTSRIFSHYLNKTKVHNLEQLLQLAQSRPKGKPLITVSNHDSCCDDPLVFGAMLPLSTFRKPLDPSYRWSLGAREVCFSKSSHSLFFRLGQVLPVVRGAGVYQPVMQEALEELNNGAWVHIFPEGKVNETKTFLRLKWGVGRLISDSKETPIVLPFWHVGMDDILPNKQPYIPRTKQKTTIVIGKPMHFDELVKELKVKQKTATEIRKQITDLIQEEFYKLKEVAYKLHEEHKISEKS